MRITNTMSTSRLMLNVNRNRTFLDKYYTQMSTGKQIQYASENPIVASRTLRFRTAVAETEQYARNVEQGYSWMEISESAIRNSEDILQKLRSLLVQGSTGSLTDADRQSVIQEIKGLSDEIGNQMNQTYAGRSVFSGYKTDELPVSNEAITKSYEITQKFDYTNIEDYKVYFKPVDPPGAVPPCLIGTPAEVFDGKRIKLPYTNIDEKTIDLTDPTTFTTISGATYPNSTIEITINPTVDDNGEITGTPEVVNAVSMTSTDSLLYMRKDPSDPESPLILSAPAVYLKDTGELLIRDYDDPTTTADDATIPGAEENEDLNGKIVAAGKFVPDVVGKKAGTGGISITYNKTQYEANDLNPKLYFDCKELDANGDVAVDVNGEEIAYSMDDQNMQYEFSVGVRINVNNLAKDMYTAEMRADFAEFYSFVDGLAISDEVDVRAFLEGQGLSGVELDKAVQDQLAEETKKSRAVGQSRFEQMIKKIDKHMTQMSKARTDMGSRMSRLELMQNRLSDDVLSYTSLLTKTEEADLFEVVTNLNAMDAMYQASLKTGMMMIRTSLADFI